MDNYLEQGRNITTALNELDKFFIEINALKYLLINTLDKFLDSSTKFKASNHKESYHYSNSGYLVPWCNISIAIFDKKRRKLTDDLAYRFINFQFSFSDESVAIPNQIDRPLIHISSSGIRHDSEWFIKYPIEEILYFDEEPGSFSLENNAIIWSNYDYGDKFWHYSIDLLKINSHNFQELLINPVYRLLHEEPLQIVPNSALDNALIRYENLESIIK